MIFGCMACLSFAGIFAVVVSVLLFGLKCWRKVCGKHTNRKQEVDK